MSTIDLSSVMAEFETAEFKLNEISMALHEIRETTTDPVVRGDEFVICAANISHLIFKLSWLMKNKSIESSEAMKFWESINNVTIPKSLYTKAKIEEISDKLIDLKRSLNDCLNNLDTTLLSIPAFESLIKSETH